METTSEKTDRAIVLLPSGRLDFSAAAPFQEAIEKTIAEAVGAKLAVILDCSGLDYLSSAGLRCFLIGARTAQAAGARLIVCSLQKAVSEVFDVSGFSRIMPPVTDRAAALAAL